LVDRIRRQGDAPLIAVLENGELSPVEKLQGFFVTVAHMRSAHEDVVVDLLRGWYADDNIRVRQKMSDAVREQRCPMLTQIMQDGVQAGMFTTANPEQAADITLTLIERMGTVQADLLLSGFTTLTRHAVIEEVLAVRAAFLAAIERVLGGWSAGGWPVRRRVRGEAPLSGIKVRMRDGGHEAVASRGQPPRASPAKSGRRCAARARCKRSRGTPVRCRAAIAG
jgi:hypothetical protein